MATNSAARIRQPSRHQYGAYAARVQIDLVALVVDEYDPAIAFFTGVLGFDLVEDSVGPEVQFAAAVAAPVDVLKIRSALNWARLCHERPL